jgi:hypothetical protein
MARKRAMPPGPKRGGGKAPPFPPIGKRKSRTAPGTPLPSPPPRPRATRGMGPPVQNMMPPPGLRARMPPPQAEELGESAAMGPATSGAVGASPPRRALARALRGGRVAF